MINDYYFLQGLILGYLTVITMGILLFLTVKIFNDDELDIKCKQLAERNMELEDECRQHLATNIRLLETLEKVDDKICKYNSTCQGYRSFKESEEVELCMEDSG